MVTIGPTDLVQVRETASQSAVGVGVPQVGTLVHQAGSESIPLGSGSQFPVGEFGDSFLHDLAKSFIGPGGAADAQHGESGRQETAGVEARQSRHELAAGQIAGGTEDDHDAGFSDAFPAHAETQWVFTSRWLPHGLRLSPRRIGCHGRRTHRATLPPGAGKTHRGGAKRSGRTGLE